MIVILDQKLQWRRFCKKLTGDNGRRKTDNNDDDEDEDDEMTFRCKILSIITID